MARFLHTSQYPEKQYCSCTWIGDEGMWGSIISKLL